MGDADRDRGSVGAVPGAKNKFVTEFRLATPFRLCGGFDSKALRKAIASSSVATANASASKNTRVHFPMCTRMHASIIAELIALQGQRGAN